MKIMAALLAVLFFPAFAFAEGQCSTVHMIASTGEYTFLDLAAPGKEEVQRRDEHKWPGEAVRVSDGILEPWGASTC